MNRTLGRLLDRAPVRFLISGGLAAFAAIGAYYVCAGLIGMAPLLANLLAFLLQFGISYHLHKAFSFRASVGWRSGMSRYAAVSLLAFLLNSAWVWLLTGPLGLSPLTPIVPMIVVTPVVTFMASRYWVFAAGE